MKLFLKLFSWFLFFLSPILCLGQTVDPGSELHDSAASVKESPDSTHHTDTAQRFYFFPRHRHLQDAEALLLLGLDQIGEMVEFYDFGGIQ